MWKSWEFPTVFWKRVIFCPPQKKSKFSSIMAFLCERVYFKPPPPNACVFVLDFIQMLGLTKKLDLNFIHRKVRNSRNSIWEVIMIGSSEIFQCHPKIRDRPKPKFEPKPKVPKFRLKPKPKPKISDHYPKMRNSHFKDSERVGRSATKSQF